MDIYTVLRIINDHRKKIVLTTLLAMSVSGIVSFFFLPSIYMVDAKILINKQSGEGVIEYNDVLTTQKLANTYGEIIKSKRIAKFVVDELNLSISPKTLLDSITVTPLKDSQVVKVSVTGTDPQRVKLILNKLLEVFQNEIGNIIRVENVEILDDVSLEEQIAPVKPKPLFNIIVAGVATAFAAIGLAIFLDFVDPTLRSLYAARREFKGMVFGPIPSTALIRKEFSKRMIKKLVEGDRHDRYKDALRKIRAQLIATEGHGATYMIASPQCGIATQRIAFDMGETFAEAGDKTLCVIFNGSNIAALLQQESEPVMLPHFLNHNMKSIEGDIGHRYDCDFPVEEIRPFFYCTTKKNLYFLGLSVNVLEREFLCNQQFIKQMLNELKKEFNTVIIAPSISMMEVSDALLFLPYTDVFMLIMEKGHTLKEVIKEVMYQVRHLDKVKTYGLYFDIDFRLNVKYKKKKEKPVALIKRGKQHRRMED
ncbi:capsular polysaccharide biosynthesis protein [Anoxybacillus voinovskiensis]|uniref:Capsular polysaccharide biosynthesis protein n=1 Tax=Anoxybacteroides voinovskiense TaxID=230470 RepID=A0A840DQ59_9BACL|nr:Wzz/FepE/Etk N-terminal domain-containing protein [Anoxybacillus voinovskiensis]MBB4073803.1 capsular polysaccharide biosynthesis protein [Anoxybacillus voinovskiensis]GGJ63772.1 hypothetical protein GCM10008982_11270 [Anoxybacillus voinovskiensis]